MDAMGCTNIGVVKKGCHMDAMGSKKKGVTWTSRGLKKGVSDGHHGVYKNWCRQNDTEFIENVGHTLWDPHEIIELNGGSPPVTFTMFNHVVSSIGL